MHNHTPHRLLAIALAVLTASSCATMFHGKEHSPDGGYFQKIEVTSTPAGARIIVDGEEKGVTPLDIYVDRRRRDVTVRLEKDGFQPREVSLPRTVGGAVMADAALGLMPFNPLQGLNEHQPSPKTKVTFAFVLPLAALLVDFGSGAIYTRDSRVYARLIPNPR